MKRFLLILILLTSTLFSSPKQGDIAFTLSGGITGGTGPGITYNLLDRLSITWNGVVISELFSEDNAFYMLTGGALRYDFFQSKSADLYTFLGIMYAPQDDVTWSSLGFAVRKHSDEKIYTGFEVGLGLYHDHLYSSTEPTFSAGLVWGYIF